MAGQIGSEPFFKRHGLPLGVQLFPLMAELAEDFEGTLETIAEIGFEYVEASNFQGKEPAELRGALDRAGLTCSGVHIMGRAIRPGDNLSGDMSGLIDKLQIVGAKTVIMPIFYFPERFPVPPLTGMDFVAVILRIGKSMSADDWKWNADFLNEKGAKLKRAGVQLAYHNHNFEFAPAGASTGLEILLEHTDPELVTFELDTGWAAAAGVDPVDLLQRHAGRFQLVHLKDLKVGTRQNYELGIEPTEVGSGKVDWHKLLPAAYRAGARHFIVEQEAPFDRPALEAMRMNFDYLSTI